MIILTKQQILILIYSQKELSDTILALAAGELRAKDILQ